MDFRMLAIQELSLIVRALKSDGFTAADIRVLLDTAAETEGDIAAMIDVLQTARVSTLRRKGDPRD